MKSSFRTNNAIVFLFLLQAKTLIPQPHPTQGIAVKLLICQSFLTQLVLLSVVSSIYGVSIILSLIIYVS